MDKNTGFQFSEHEILILYSCFTKLTKMDKNFEERLCNEEECIGMARELVEVKEPGFIAAGGVIRSSTLLESWRKKDNNSIREEMTRKMRGFDDYYLTCAQELLWRCERRNTGLPATTNPPDNSLFQRPTGPSDAGLKTLRSQLRYINPSPCNACHGNHKICEHGADVNNIVINGYTLDREQEGILYTCVVEAQIPLEISRNYNTSEVKDVIMQMIEEKEPGSVREPRWRKWVPDRIIYDWRKGKIPRRQRKAILERVDKNRKAYLDKVSELYQRSGISSEIPPSPAKPRRSKTDKLLRGSPRDEYSKLLSAFPVQKDPALFEGSFADPRSIANPDPPQTPLSPRDENPTPSVPFPRLQKKVPEICGILPTKEHLATLFAAATARNGEEYEFAQQQIQDIVRIMLRLTKETDHGIDKTVDKYIKAFRIRDHWLTIRAERLMPSKVKFQKHLSEARELYKEHKAHARMEVDIDATRFHGEVLQVTEAVGSLGLGATSRFSGSQPVALGSFYGSGDPSSMGDTHLGGYPSDLEYQHQPWQRMSLDNSRSTFGQPQAQADISSFAIADPQAQRYRTQRNPPKYSDYGPQEFGEVVSRAPIEAEEREKPSESSSSRSRESGPAPQRRRLEGKEEGGGGQQRSVAREEKSKSKHKHAGRRQKTSTKDEKAEQDKDKKKKRSRPTK